MSLNDLPESMQPDDDEVAAGTLVVRARWYTTDEAARILGISTTAVRKRIASGELTSVRAGRGRRVLLLGEAPSGPSRSAEAQTPADPAPVPESETSADNTRHADEIAVLARTSDSLTGLVRDLQRQSLALAGQIGYLQHQLVEAQERVKLLEQHPPSEAQTVTGVDPEEHARVTGELAQIRQKLVEAERRNSEVRESIARSRWRFWRRSV